MGGREDRCSFCVAARNYHYEPLHTDENLASDDRKRARCEIRACNPSLFLECFHPPTYVSDAYCWPYVASAATSASSNHLSSTSVDSIPTLTRMSAPSTPNSAAHGSSV